jgi:hypothetical protein
MLVPLKSFACPGRACPGVCEQYDQPKSHGTLSVGDAISSPFAPCFSPVFELSGVSDSGVPFRGLRDLARRRGLVLAHRRFTPTEESGRKGGGWRGAFGVLSGVGKLTGGDGGR